MAGDALYERLLCFDDTFVKFPWIPPDFYFLSVPDISMVSILLGRKQFEIARCLTRSCTN